MRVFGLLAVAAATAVFVVGGAQASGSVTVSSTANFSQANAGGACPGSGCTYAMVTVTNNTDAAVTLTVASAAVPFWPTYGGTCNVQYAYNIPAGASCTFEWGFQPTRPGRATGTGTISFSDGESVSVALVGNGRGNPH